ncbi:MAG: homoserine dehydrogenase, partial [Cyanobacteria bacterium P01_H01_bin.15]
LPPGVLTTDLKAITTDPDIDIVVELLGGLEPSRSLILEAIKNGKHIVTANKAVIARHGDEIFMAADEAGVYVMIEGAVGGGIPVISPLQQSLGANRIERIIGIVNGTTNYILTEMTQKGADFADVLANAQELGYAEADPTADVDGWDAADKIAILASLGFGGRIERERIPCEGIRKISAVDIDYAKRLNFIIKLLAIAERKPEGGLLVRVHPTLVPNDHPLGGINGVFNAILVEGEPLGQVMFFGPGAGAGPTASAVVADLLNIVALIKQGKTSSLHSLLNSSHQNYCVLEPEGELETRFYARFLTKDLAGVIGTLGTSFGEHGVSLESVVQTGFQGNLAEIIVVTHDVKAGDFATALEGIAQFDAVEEIASVIKVL